MSHQPPVEASPAAPTPQELGAAVVELAAIQMELIKRLEAAIGKSASVGMSGTANDAFRRSAPTLRPFDASELHARSQNVLRWLLDHLPASDLRKPE